ncbi:hypothetical protein A2U01_0090593, partial [Trifolium medium]|nr:hypothetical protein [Trifolium medium]
MCGGSFPVPRPEVPAREFLPPSPIFGAPNGTIPAEIRSDGCKLTTLRVR